MKSLRAKKSLGQHFLRSKAAINKIVEAGKVMPGDLVLEVGPGRGVLTEALLNAGAHVIAIEKDRGLVTELSIHFEDALEDGRLDLICGDILDKKLQEEIFHTDLAEKRPYKVVANIPYYITGLLFRLFLEKLRQPTDIVFLVQKEVAEQIVARSGKESILSLAVKVYGTPRFIATVRREAFSPPPKVDSAIIAITNISRTRLGKLSDEEYFRVVKAGFSAKRKMLLGNLARARLRPTSDGQGLNIPREKLSEIFRTLGLDGHIRGEDVPAEKWIALAWEIKKIS